MTQLDNSLAGALWCAARGWSVHPCDGKVPTTRWAESATTDVHTITAWLAGTSLNYGIACGPSGLLVLDDDTGDALADYAASVGKDAPDTFTVITGRGLHYYFEAPARPIGNGRGRLPEKVDVRGVGGYVIGPGSVHSNGAPYVVANGDTPVAPLPAWLLDLIVEPGDFDALQRDYSGPIPSGQRHQALVSYAGHLRHLDLAPDEREALMLNRWKECEQPSGSRFEWPEAKAILDDVVGRYGAAPDREQRFDVEVAQEAHRLRVLEAARELVRVERTPPAPPMDVALLDEVDDEPVRYRIDNLLPMGGNALIVAKRKTGKSTMLLNLSRALRSGEPFLGVLPVEPITGRVAFLNFEVDRAMLARWAREAGLTSADLVLVNLRGRRNPLGNEADGEELRHRLRQHRTDVLIVDPLSKAFTGTNINDTGEMTHFLAGLDRLRDDVGATSILLAAHAGWNSDRARNSSAVEDWADSIVTMTSDEQGRRYLSAIGRDVDLDEDRLDFDLATRRLTLSGVGGRRVSAAAERLSELADAVVAIVTAEPGLTSSEIESRLRERGHGLQNGDASKAARAAEGSQRITRAKEGRAVRHYANNTPRHPPTYPDGGADVPQPPHIGGGVRPGVIDEHTPRAVSLLQNVLGAEVVA